MAKNVYQEVTARIIEELENGTVPWVKPWNSASASGLPFNFSSGKHYNGINIPLLWMEQNRQGYLSDSWMTFKQAKEKGGCVRKGEHGTRIIFWRFLEKRDAETDEAYQVPMARIYTVFNLDQIDGIARPDEAKPLPTVISTNATADQFICNTGAEIRYGGDRAYCSRQTGHVQLPYIDAFLDTHHFYATALHELTHWSGHKGRLDRSFGKRFGDQAYAAEELVAEMGSAFLCAQVGVKGQLQHASYIENWIKLLKKDDRAIITAASKAQKAADFLWGLQDQAAAA
ncbi:MAG: zincin-like metallopeptidase domain-containing protein [Candidatus Sedimenticola sp. (ex Thyasira tokunagai)]